MPIYSFECAACGHDFDRLQKLSDADPTDCPKCGAPQQIRRRLTAPQFRLAGGGWYETDFKKDGDKKRNLAGDGTAPKSDASSGGGDSKPASSTPAPSAPASSPAPSSGSSSGTSGSSGGSSSST
ncbi:FmdB family zinc ribbon protein [Lysobacter sp. HA35]